MSIHRLYTLTADGWHKARYNYKNAKLAYVAHVAAISNEATIAVSWCSHTPDDGTDEPPAGAGVYGTLCGVTVETLISRGIVRRDEYGRAVLAKHVPETDGMCEGSLFGDLDGNPFATDETTEVMEGRRVRQ